MSSQWLFISLHCVTVCKPQLVFRVLIGSVSQMGIIEEMMEDTMESIDDQDDLEEEAQEEVDKILFEITKGKQW